MPNTVPVSDRPHHVYALVDPAEPDRYWYIGASSLPLAARLNSHLATGRHPETKAHGADVVAWIQTVLAAGRRPQIVKLADADNQADAEAMEDFAIALFRQEGHPLTNGRGGGRSKFIGASAERRRARGPAWRPARPIRDLNTGIIYPSQTKAAAALGVAQANVSACLRGVVKTTGGHRLAYAEVT